ncbi:MAG: DUF4185 domain-containing protein [Pyrinomonadaceae bacterium]
MNRAAFLTILLCLSIATVMRAQPDPTRFTITAWPDSNADRYFTHDRVWRGADGASSIDLGEGRVLWLFGDSIISRDWTGTRVGSFVRNSVGVQAGYELTAPIKYYWKPTKRGHEAFFSIPGKNWFWPGHGTMIRDRLIIFLFQLRGVNTGLGFEAFSWYAVLVSNPSDEPSKWKMKYIQGPETFGQMAGSAAVLKDDKYLYAFGAQEPSTHEVYLLRWPLDDAYNGELGGLEWWLNGKWAKRPSREPIPTPLFIGGTEYSVHFDASIDKYLQIQSFGFGDATIGLRMADRPEGPWSKPKTIYRPSYTGIKQPFMYSAKAHPELRTDGLYITYNVNSFDFSHMLENLNTYFPKFIRLRIEPRR